MAIKVNSLSYSTITQYSLCSERVWLEKIVGAERKGVGAALIFGSAIHSAAEVYHRSLALGQPIDAVPLKRVFRQAWDRNPESEIVYGKSSREDLFVTADKLLDLLVEADRPYQVVGVERNITYHLTNTISIVGRLDLLTRDRDGSLVLWDLKTRSRKQGDDEARATTEQAYFYALALSEPVKLRTRVLYKLKSPRIEDIDLDIDRIDYNQVCQKAVMVARAIEAGVHYQSRGWQCGSCPYSYLCDAAGSVCADDVNEYREAA